MLGSALAPVLLAATATAALVAHSEQASGRAQRATPFLAALDFNHTKAAEQITAELADDWVVQRGSYTFFFLEDCVRLGLPSCFALNADTPYGLLGLPRAPGEAQMTDCTTGTFLKAGKCGLGCPGEAGEDLFETICLDAPDGGAGQEIQWRLREDEAVVFVGLSPPESVYWSITSYLRSTRYGRGGERVEPLSSVDPWVYQIAASCPGGPARCEKFASLEQPFNHQTLQSSTGGTGFSEPFALVLTASNASWSVAQQAAARLGIPTFLSRIPSDITNMGTDTNDRDTFYHNLRVAFPRNATEMAAYFDTKPMSILRLTPRAPAPAPELYLREDLHFVEKATGVMEHVEGLLSHEELKTAMLELEEKIFEKHGGRRFPFEFMRPFFVNGLDCIDQGTECNGDCPDAVYPIGSNIFYAEGCKLIPFFWVTMGLCLVSGLCCSCCFAAPTRSRGCRAPAAGLPEEVELREVGEKAQPEPLDWRWAGCCPCALGSSRSWWSGVVLAGLLGALLALGLVSWAYGSWCFWGHAATIDSGDHDFYVAYGVNHKATGMATYASITAYYRDTMTGLHSGNSESDFPGSAEVYLGDEHPAAPYLYAYRFARDCEKAGLVEGYCASIPKTGDINLPEDGFIMFIVRAYINPATGTGPDMHEIVYGRVLHYY